MEPEDDYRDERPHDPPAYNDLWTFQQEHANILIEILRRQSAALDTSDTGTGKTRVACLCARELGLSLFVVCPKAVIENWFDTAEMYGTQVIGVVNYESAKNCKYYSRVGQYFAEEREQCPYLEKEEATWKWDLPPDTLLVFDEVHRGKNRDTQTSELITASAGMPHKLLLSATVCDKINTFHPVAYLLGKAQLGQHAYRRWLRNIKREGELITQSIHRNITSHPAVSHRMSIAHVQNSRDEVLRNLFKHNDVRAQLYDMSPEVEEEIERAHGEIQDALRQLKTKQRGETCPLTIILRARQRIEMLKAPTMVMCAMEEVLSGRSAILFVNFTETINKLFDQLDPFVQEDAQLIADEQQSFITFIQGGQSPTDRKYNIEAFQSDKSRICIVNIAAGGVGLSLHDTHGNFPRTTLISPTWSSDDLMQVLGRAHRAGGLTDVRQRIIYCRGRVSGVAPVVPGTTIVHNGELYGPEHPRYDEILKLLDDSCGNDTTMRSDGVRVGVEEYIAANVNKKLETLFWINNGKDAGMDDLLKI